MQKNVLKNIIQNCSINGIKFLKDDPYINYVPLQMTQFMDKNNPNVSGHQHTRKEIFSLFRNPIMGNLQPENFFEKSKNFVRDSSDYKRALTLEAKENCLNQNGNVVGIIGQAGIGKTTFTKVLLSRILSEEKLYNADFTFYVKLRNFYNAKSIHLLKFLTGNIQIDWTEADDRRNHVLNQLSESESVCILLDGLDEIVIDRACYKDQSEMEFNIYSKELPQYFILGILCGKILPKAKVIVTSRPRQMLDLPEFFVPKFLVTILGVNKQGQEQICKDICGSYKEQVYAHIQKHPDLFSYCFVPINCILLVHCIFQQLNTGKDKNKCIPTNITEVLALTLRLFVETEHIRKSVDWKNLSKLAWSGIEKRKFYFDDKDLQSWLE